MTEGKFDCRGERKLCKGFDGELPELMIGRGSKGRWERGQREKSERLANLSAASDAAAAGIRKTSKEPRRVNEPKREEQ